MLLLKAGYIQHISLLIFNLKTFPSHFSHVDWWFCSAMNGNMYRKYKIKGKYFPGQLHNMSQQFRCKAIQWNSITRFILQI